MTDVLALVAATASATVLNTHGILEFLAALPRRVTPHHLHVPLDHLLGVERAIPSGDALNHEARSARR